MSWLAELRALTPRRPLNWLEARWVAERQANRLLALTGVATPPVPEEVISLLPRVYVERVHPVAPHGATQWIGGRWVILLRAADCAERQRFSLAHELKHAIDHPFVSFLYPTTPYNSGHKRAEQAAHYFAASLLMPKAWLLDAYYRRGIKDTPDLARCFRVSVQAMELRLGELGLLQPRPRCGYEPQLHTKTARSTLSIPHYALRRSSATMKRVIGDRSHDARPTSTGRNNAA